ncbi:uncharacterized protein HRG_06209 [Hirsutella rhossiliensis]|uniref:Peptidase S8/S53 domain-containing protein n=1 Tax=Hirsutella rhossiliensis TaxID=111463 RepID=A0A9P8MYR8_9HYPO|nr:uncharacterized protein HRG_06209 [Hirsutella rhossiliensis]KAH0963699.1 hypothetical protein HRG_06209 [Hirsutella rhossiliensis]
MTHINELHREDLTGNDIKVAIINTRVNCVGDGADPMDCHGHGTSIVAGYDPEDVFKGAAPNATIHAYRVTTCKTEKDGEITADVTEDNLMAGWLKAHNGGAQIIVSSDGFQGSS